MTVFMRILVDGDACPVIDITREIAERFLVELIIFTDITHYIDKGYGKVVVLDQAFQAVDLAIVNRCQPGDIIITQDYGLAALALGKGAVVLDQNGRIFTEENIDYLLMKRHLHARIRRGGGRHPTQGKRQGEDDLHFAETLTKIIEEITNDK